MRNNLAEKLNIKRQVTIIPATKVLSKGLDLYGMTKKKRVAGYARVSTDEENQVSSYEAQIDYYKKYILEHDSWEFVDLYSDEGITGCNTKHREGFKRMIADALDGKIDLIVTKSISRFARNTVDSLSTIRKLKEHNVGVYFEKENINTLDANGELLLTILSSLAQEESRSISENSTWGQRKRFSDGKYSVAYSKFMGYDKDFKVNAEQAKVVRYIFDSFIAGSTYGEIKHDLEDKNILTPAGKKKWYIDVIKRMIMNEKYCGDALLQKSFTPDFLTKKHVQNKGQVKQYFISDGHEPIITREKFELAQLEVKRRAEIMNKKRDIFSGKLYCKECGDKYYKCRSYLRDNDGKHIKTYTSYKCDSNGRGCTSHYINISIVKDKFIETLKNITKDKKSFMLVLEAAEYDLNTDNLKDEIAIINDKIEALKQGENTQLKTTVINRLLEEQGNIERKIVVNNERLKIIDNMKKDDATKLMPGYTDELFMTFIDKAYIDKDKKVDIILKGMFDSIKAERSKIWQK